MRAHGRTGGGGRGTSEASKSGISNGLDDRASKITMGEVATVACGYWGIDWRYHVERHGMELRDKNKTHLPSLLDTTCESLVRYVAYRWLTFLQFIFDARRIGMYMAWENDRHSVKIYAQATNQPSECTVQDIIHFKPNQQSTIPQHSRSRTGRKHNGTQITLLT